MASPAHALQGNTGIHDPSTIVKRNGVYHVFGTGNGISHLTSTDLIRWNTATPIFASGTWPSWIKTSVPGFAGDFWAPDCIEMNGKYYLYYSCSTFGSKQSAIGLVTSSDLVNWTDQGLVVSSGQSTSYNAIDPAMFRDANNRLWMTFGSFWTGIWMTELNTTTGLRLNSTFYNIATKSGAEASYVVRHGNYYYLFYNEGACCQGTSSTYHIMMGRSTSPQGPYTDKNGQALSSGGGTEFLNTSGRYIGPGHFGLLSDNGVEYLSYHFYDGNANGAPTLRLSNLRWAGDGWPFASPDWINNGRYGIRNQGNNLAWQSGSDQPLAPVQQNNFKGQSSQQWDFTGLGDGAYKITSTQSGLASGLAGGTNSAGTKLDLYSYLGVNSQQWNIERASNGNYVLSSVNGNRVVDVPSGSTNAGTQLQIWDYNGLASQLWQITPTTEIYTTDVTNGSYTLTPRHASDKLMTVLDTSANNAAPVGIKTSTGAKNQQFLFDAQSDGTYRIRTGLASHRAVELPSGVTTNGTKVQLWDDNGLSPQRWYLIPVGDGWYKIAPRNDITKSMDVENLSTQDGALVQSWDYLGGTNQQWKFTAINPANTNVAPVINSVTVTPTNATTNSTLTAHVGATDDDGDTLTTSYVWKKNSVVIAGQTSSTLDLSQTGNGDKGDGISVTVTVSDGKGGSVSGTSAPVTVGNTAPQVSVSLTPATPGTNSLLTANVTSSDADGDTVTPSYVWKKNGTIIVGETGSTLDLSKAGNGDEDDNISVTVTATDGTGSSSASNSAVISSTNKAPSVVSLSPTSASDTVGSTRAFTLTVSDPNGLNDISSVWFMANTQLDWSDGVTLVYDQVRNTLYLRDGDHFAGPITPGSGTLTNGAVVVNGSSVTVTRSVDGRSLTLSFSLQIKNGLVGTNGVWGRVEDLSGSTDSTAIAGQFGWVKKGTWRVAGATGSYQAPKAIVSPGARGTTTPLTAGREFELTLDVTDPNGAGDLNSAYVLVNNLNQLDWGNGLTLCYDARNNRLYLRSTDGNTFLGGNVVGQGSGLLENAAGSIRLNGCRTTPLPNGVRLTIPITLKSTFLGTKQVWSRVEDTTGAVAADSNANFGFKTEGTWNVAKSGTTTAATRSTNPSAPSS